MRARVSGPGPGVLAQPYSCRCSLLRSSAAPSPTSSDRAPLPDRSMSSSSRGMPSRYALSLVTAVAGLVSRGVGGSGKPTARARCSRVASCRSSARPERAVDACWADAISEPKTSALAPPQSVAKRARRSILSRVVICSHPCINRPNRYGRKTPQDGEERQASRRLLRADGDSQSTCQRTATPSDI